MNSPLRAVLSQKLFISAASGDPGSAEMVSASIADAVFGLDVQFTNEHQHGYSVAIPSIEANTSASEHDLFGFGMLLGYCYVLGIQDLHAENVIRSHHRLQVIDAEVVLSRLRLPNETLLLPFRDTPFGKAGVRHYFASAEDVNIAAAQTILAGFSAALIELDRVATPLLGALNQAIDQHKGATVPIRVILRDTSKYRDWQTQQAHQEPFFPEEVEQLKRGDIPYFFKYLGQSQLYYFTSSSGDHALAHPPAHFQTIADCVGHPPDLLVSQTRIRKELFAPGLLLLLRKVIPPAWNGSLDLGTVRMIISANDLELRSTWGNFSAPRHRAK